MLRNKYDPKDFSVNPNKYALFRTAIVARSIITENGEDDLEAGRAVAIRHIRNAWNGVHHRDEPVYSVTADGKVWGMVFGNVLGDFML